jgi:hypothetical protein
MKRISFKLAAGLIIAAIIGLAATAASLALAIFERETNARATAVIWPTPTGGQQGIATFWIGGPTPASAERIIVPSSTPPVIPTLAPDQQTLPPNHPDIGLNSAPCADCHQVIHKGGG